MIDYVHYSRLIVLGTIFVQICCCCYQYMSLALELQNAQMYYFLSGEIVIRSISTCVYISHQLSDFSLLFISICQCITVKTVLYFVYKGCQLLLTASQQDQLVSFLLKLVSFLLGLVGFLLELVIISSVVFSVRVSWLFVRVSYSQFCCIEVYKYLDCNYLQLVFQINKISFVLFLFLYYLSTFLSVYQKWYLEPFFRNSVFLQGPVMCFHGFRSFQFYFTIISQFSCRET